MTATEFAPKGYFRAAMQPSRIPNIVALSSGSRTVQNLMCSAGCNFVVTTDEPTALTDAYALIKTRARAEAADSVRILLNMASHSYSGQNTYQTLLKACEGFLRVSPPLAGIIRRDTHVPDSIRHQTSLITRHPNCDAAQDVAALAEKIRGRL